MEDGYIDVHHTERRYQRTVHRFETDDTISHRNRERVLHFLRDAALGKTRPKSAKKRVGHARLTSYLDHLTILSRATGKDLDAVTQDDMERFIEAWDNDRIRQQPRNPWNNSPTTLPKPYSASYKVGVKMTIRKFYKWLYGNNTTFPPLVEWIDTSFTWPDVSTLTEAEVERMVDLAPTIRQRAIIQVLFDSGLRLGELLNVRLRDVMLRPVAAGASTESCFFIHVPFSKTLTRTIPLPMHATNKWLSLWLEQHPAHPTIQADGSLATPGLSMQLFPTSSNNVRLIIHRAGKTALKKRVWPHLLRHASATYWSNKLTSYQLCRRFGWTMTSSMAQRYIDRQGINEVAAAEVYFRERQASNHRESSQRGWEAAFASIEMTATPAERHTKHPEHDLDPHSSRLQQQSRTWPPQHTGSEIAVAVVHPVDVAGGALGPALGAPTMPHPTRRQAVPHP